MAGRLPTEIIHKVDGTISVYAQDGTEIVNFDGANDRMTFKTGGVRVDSPTGTLGFVTGAGGAVTQITNAATAVTLNKPCGQITTVALTTAAAAEEAFVVNNSLVAATDIIVVNTTYAGGGKPIVFVTNVGAGVFTINISNVHATAALDAVLVVNFAIIKGVAA